MPPSPNCTPTRSHGCLVSDQLASVRIAAKPLEQFVSATFHAAGAKKHDADCVAKSLVTADLAGHPSHGVIRVASYLQAINQGLIDVRANPEVIGDDGATARVDAHDCFGQVAGRFAIGVAIAKAREYGVSTVALFRSYHVGRLGDYVAHAAAEQMVGLGFCTATGADGRVAPFGSKEPIFGTNPFAAAIPSSDSQPVILDFATSAVAEGKLRVAVNKGESVPEGWLLTPDGEPTSDPSDHYIGGPLLTFGGHKGSGFAIINDLLGGVLAGKGTRALPGLVSGNGVLFVVIDVCRLQPVIDFLAGVAAHSQMIRNATPAPGIEEVMVPGDPEQRAAAKHERYGIPIDIATWTALTDAAGAHSIKPPECLPDA